MIKAFQELRRWFEEKNIQESENVTVIIRCSDRRTADTIYRSLVQDLPRSALSDFSYPVFNGRRTTGSLVGVKIAVEFDRRES